MRIGVPILPARRRACIGPIQRNTKEKASPAGARGALHAKAYGRARAITAQASTSRLSCHGIGGRRLVHHRRRHPRQAHHRKHIQTASRRRHPRQEHHRKQQPDDCNTTRCARRSNFHTGPSRDIVTGCAFTATNLTEAARNGKRSP